MDVLIHKSGGVHLAAYMGLRKNPFCCLAHTVNACVDNGPAVCRKRYTSGTDHNICVLPKMAYLLNVCGSSARNTPLYNCAARTKATITSLPHTPLRVKRQNMPFHSQTVQRFSSTQCTPGVVIPPLPRTCAHGIQVAISTEVKKITRPSGAATPRDSDTLMRIAVPKAFCVLREHTGSRPKSGKVRLSDTRPGDVRECAVCVEGSDTAPSEMPPCFGV